MPRRRAGAVILGSRSGKTGASAATTTISTTRLSPTTSSGRSVIMFRRFRAGPASATRGAATCTDRSATSGMAQTRIDVQIEGVGGEVNQHIDACDQQHAALHQRVVALENGVH